MKESAPVAPMPAKISIAIPMQRQKIFTPLFEPILTSGCAEDDRMCEKSNAYFGLCQFHRNFLEIKVEKPWNLMYNK